jgi:VanZ family protein
VNKKIFFSAYLLAIILLVVLPVNDKNSKINHTYILSIRLDYIAHALLFCPWMFFYSLVRPFSFARRITKTGWLFAGLFFASLAELVQHFTPYRTLNIKDLLANAAGILLGATLFMFLESKNTRNERADH